jgi:hypothetical protein
MNADETLKITEDMQQIVRQMFEDDIEENPDVINEFFDCAACGQSKTLAGSVVYGHYRLCNDCVLFAEVGFALKKFKNIQDLIDAMEEKRLEEICEFIRTDCAAQNN